MRAQTRRNTQLQTVLQQHSRSYEGLAPPAEPRCGEYPRVFNGYLGTLSPCLSHSSWLRDISDERFDVHYVDDGLGRREGAYGGRDDGTDPVHRMEDCGDQADPWLDVGLHDRGACVRTEFGFECVSTSLPCMTSWVSLIKDIS